MTAEVYQDYSERRNSLGCVEEFQRTAGEANPIRDTLASRRLVRH